MCQGTSRPSNQLNFSLYDTRLLNFSYLWRPARAQGSSHALPAITHVSLPTGISSHHQLNASLLHTLHPHRSPFFASLLLFLSESKLQVKKDGGGGYSNRMIIYLKCLSKNMVNNNEWKISYHLITCDLDISDSASYRKV